MTELLGSAAGVRRGWRATSLTPDEVLARLAPFGWLAVPERREIVEHRAWKDRKGLRRIDAAFAGGSRVSVRWLRRGTSIHLSRWAGL